PILKANSFRPCQGNRVEVKLDVMRTGRQNEFTSSRLRRSSDSDFLHENGRFGSITGQPSKVEHGQALYGGNPKFVIARYSQVGRADAALGGNQAIGLAEPRILERRVVEAFRLRKNRRWYPKNSVSSGEPHILAARRRHAEDIQIVVHLQQ